MDDSLNYNYGPIYRKLGLKRNTNTDLNITCIRFRSISAPKVDLRSNLAPKSISNIIAQCWKSSSSLLSTSRSDSIQNDSEFVETQNMKIMHLCFGFPEHHESLQTEVGRVSYGQNDTAAQICQICPFSRISFLFVSQFREPVSDALQSPHKENTLKALKPT